MDENHINTPTGTVKVGESFDYLSDSAKKKGKKAKTWELVRIPDQSRMPHGTAKLIVHKPNTPEDETIRLHFKIDKIEKVVLD